MYKIMHKTLVASGLFTSILLSSLVPSVAVAGDTKTEAINKLPLEEKAFVDAINKFDKTKIMAQLGKPAKEDDIKLKDSGKIVASIWQYHNINKAADGTTYQTTELDFVDDQVVQVVFLNNDGSETNDNQTYEVAPISPDETPQGFTPMNPPAGM